MDSHINFYEDLLRENQGIFKMKIKMPVRDTKSLGLVYTPGVAASCLEIKNEKNKALKYTNRMNSMLVVSDSSGITHAVEGRDWNNMAVIPYLEAICVYYKNLANIDAYPLVIDHSKIKNEEELYETVKAIMPAFSGIEFFEMCPERLKGFYEIVKRENKNFDFHHVDSSKKRKLDDELKANKISIRSNLIYSAVIRAALDTQTHGDLNIIIDHVVSKIFKNCDHQCEYDFSQILKFATEYIFAQKLFTLKNSEYTLNNEELTVEYVLNKYNKFLIYGEDAWVGQIPFGFLSHKKTNDENSLLLHSRYRGVVGAGSKILMRSYQELDRLFTWENLDRISNILLEKPEEASVLTCKTNLGAIITNGTAILGLGNIGTLAGLPVMEGKSVLFKLYGGTDIVPFCIDEADPVKVVTIVSRITPIFSIINLEDIKSPDCFTIEPILNEMTDFPVFHDDQHGTAVVVLAGIINALKLRKGKNISEVKIIMNGAGAAGLSVTRVLMNYGAKNFVICDTEGAIYQGREKNMNDYKNKLAQMTNFNKEKGKLSDVIKEADIFIGVSGPKVLSKEMVKSMSKDPIIFALANPAPEIFPDEAKEAGAFIVATGRSDFPNQVNNSLAFPGIFRAAVDVRAKNITIEMLIAASEAIAKLVPQDQLRPEFIIPGSLDTSTSMAVCSAVAEVAINNHENRDLSFTSDLIYENIHNWFLEEKLTNFTHIKKMNVQWKI